MIVIAGILILLFAINLVAKSIYSDKINIHQMLIIYSLVLLTTYPMYLIAKSAETHDIEILSGQVISKSREKVPCSHFYDCNCHMVHSGYGHNRTSSEQCAQCPKYPYEVDWDVSTTIGGITINREDEQGLIQPTRWGIIKNSDPVSKSVSYTNYIKAVPDSLYHRTDNDPAVAKISYPDDIYDYYRINRVVNDGTDIPDDKLQELNDKISLSLRDVAPVKQVNLVIVLTKNTNSMFVQNLKASWLGGKKNDLIIVIDILHYPDIINDAVFSWSSNDMVNVSIRDSVHEYGKLDTHVVDLAIDGINKYWVRKQMKTYQYLSVEIEPSTMMYGLIFLVGLIDIVGSVIYFNNRVKKD